ncbi:hypothetical protein L6164_018320 [Bauhinia variegata]|uniref:Uncharacterized protein n=1 Tax=Bauhinia variegata TaxID=167791 RepID=A0ACB9NBV8_BAUVA|nr:hypothetical protein L6164_018320 [Bauhinia variegata]
MGMARLLGGSTPRFLVQVLSIKPYRTEFLAVTRGPVSSGLGTGGGGQTNSGVGTTIVKEPVGPGTQKKDNSSKKGNGHVNDKTAKTNG